jgi:cytochrome c-type biogenesis protein CcmH
MITTGTKIGRRDFLVSALATLGVAAVVGAQEDTRNTTGAPMNDHAYRPVRLPPRADATPKLTESQRNDLEHQLQCQCGCTLDVFTCRTTDFSCPISPSMHMDVMGLVAGGYGADEILAAFRKVYGERVLMLPVKQGFNWAAYVMPFGMLLAGAVLVFVLLKRWSRPEAAAAPNALDVDATPEELAALRDRLRDEG